MKIRKKRGRQLLRTLGPADELAVDIDEGQLLGARQLLDGVQARLAPVVVGLHLSSWAWGLVRRVSV